MTRMPNLSLVTVLAYLAFYLSIVRATGIALFLPSDELLLGTIDYLQHTLVNYTLLLLLVGYIFISNDYRFIQIFLRSPLLLLLSIGAILSVLFSTEVLVSLKFVITVIVISFPPIIFAYRFGTSQMVKHFAYFVIIMTFANLAYLLVFPEYAIMTNAHAGRWKGLFEHKNGFGPFFAVGFFILAYQLHDSSIWKKLLIFIAMMLSFLFVLKSGSATAVVCFSILILITPLFLITFRMPPLERFVIFLGIVSTLPLLFISLGPAISQVIFDLTGRDATLTGRTGIWEVMMRAVWEKPLLGYGAGLAQRPSFIAQFHDEIGFEAATAHNSFIDVMLNFGIPITAIISFLLFRTLFKGLFAAYSNKSQLYYNSLACGLLVVVIAVSFASSGALVGRSVLWMYFIVAGIILLMKKEFHSTKYSKVSSRYKDR